MWSEFAKREPIDPTTLFTDKDYSVASENLKNHIAQMMVDEIQFVFQTEFGPNALCRSKYRGKEADRNNAYSFKIIPLVPPNADFFNSSVANEWKYRTYMEIYKALISGWKNDYTSSLELTSQFISKVKKPELDKPVVQEKKEVLAIPFIQSFSVPETPASLGLMNLLQNTVSLANFSGAVDINLNTLPTTQSSDLPLTTTSLSGATVNSDRIDRLADQIGKLVEAMTPTPSVEKVFQGPDMQVQDLPKFKRRTRSKSDEMLRLFRQSRMFYTPKR